MLIILGLLICGAGFWLLQHFARAYSGAEFAGQIGGICCGIMLLAGVICIPVGYMEVMGEIAEFRSVQSTLGASRASGSESERYAVLMKVADSNKWLASQKYYNSTIFDIWIPDEIEALEPIQ